MHFIEELFSREIGGLRHKYFKKKTRDSCIRQSRKLLRYVVLSNRRKFVKLPTIVSNGQVIYEDGKLYLGKARQACVNSQLSSIFFQTNVAQSVAEFIFYTSQKARNLVIFFKIWGTKI